MFQLPAFHLSYCHAFPGIPCSLYCMSHSHNQMLLILHTHVQMLNFCLLLLQAHSNGYVTLPTPGSTGHYSFTPSDLGSLSGDPMIAAYWADADLRAGNGSVFYRESAADFELNHASSLIQARYGGAYRPTSVIVVTWNETGYYNMHTDKACY